MNRWGVIIGLVSMVNAAAMLVSMSVGIMRPDIKDEFALAPAQSGILGAISPLATIVLSVPVSALVSRSNPRHMMVGGSLHTHTLAADLAVALADSWRGSAREGLDLTSRTDP